MAEVGDTQQQSQQVAAKVNSPPTTEIEEAEKAGESEAKNEERNLCSLEAEPKVVDKLDELSSLEQEIAKMHNIMHGTESGLDEEESEADALLNSSGVNKSVNGSDAQLMDELSNATVANKEINEQTATEARTLEDVDLIALLKGTDQEQEQEQQQPVVPADLGVTIEGEGQYEIMEIDDGDNASGPSPVVVQSKASSPTGAKFTSPLGGKQKLTAEEARAVALEQMADLTAQKSRRKDPSSSSAMLNVKPPLDIINSLNDDWSEYDSGGVSDSNSQTLAPLATKKPLLLKKTNLKVMLKSTTQKTLDKLKPAVEQAISLAEDTGFKRTRVIKRKIIWDPDVPETQKSFAQYASVKGPTTTATTAVITTTTTTVPKATCLAIASKRVRPATPKEPKNATTSAKQIESNAGSPPKRRSQTPNVPNGAPSQGKKKKVSEIDRLMGDEGAANMMQAVEREKRELSGGEAANKPLMRKRALTLTGKLQKTGAVVAPAPDVEVTPTIPKKESPPKANKRAATNTTESTASNVDAVFAKKSKPRASASWDYVYKQRASEESMIMRRRSNSSYSSNASVSRLSLDNKPAAVANLSDDASDASAIDPSFKFLKPETKANQRSDGDAPQTLTNDLKRGGLQPKEAKSVKVELITLHKLEKVAQLIINTQLCKTGYTYKLQLLQKLTELLNKLAKSNDCNTVLMSVQGQQFCQGIDCQELVAATLEKRKNSATQLALVLKTYLRTLATFPKPLVAGIVGNLKNLGVMQLPLLDYVVAADDCCFETNYADLGQLPEGYALWHKHQKVSTEVQSRLFLLGERLHTSDVLESPSSFIDKSCKACSVNDEALAVAKLISSTTADHYRLIKKLNHTANTASLQRLEAEFKIITEQWSSANFQASYKRYVNDVST